MNKTLEELEGDYWQIPSNFPTTLVEKIFFLRKTKIKNLDSNDIRLLLSQNIGLKCLVPIAIEKLKSNLLEEALFYPGDLLLAVLNINSDYWIKNGNQQKALIQIIKKRNLTKDIEKITIDDDIIKELHEAVNKFNSSI